MNVIIHADWMKPKLKQTVFRVNGVNQMRQELPVLLVSVRHQLGRGAVGYLNSVT